jgi:hypothetical protein
MAESPHVGCIDCGLTLGSVANDIATPVAEANGIAWVGTITGGGIKRGAKFDYSSPIKQESIVIVSGTCLYVLFAPASFKVTVPQLKIDITAIAFPTVAKSCTNDSKALAALAGALTIADWGTAVTALDTILDEQ